MVSYKELSVSSPQTLKMKSGRCEMFATPALKLVQTLKIESGRCEMFATPALKLIQTLKIESGRCEKFATPAFNLKDAKRALRNHFNARFGSLRFKVTQQEFFYEPYRMDDVTQCDISGS